MFNRTLHKSLVLIAALACPVLAGAAAGDAPAAAPAASTAPVREGFHIYPPTQSVFARYVDNVTNFINIVSVVCFVGIIVFMVVFAVKFRRRDPHQKALSQVSHNTALELSWTLPPLVLCFLMFYLGFDGFLKLNTPPDNAYTVYVTAQKWAWSFKHPNGRIDARETVTIDGQDRDIPAVLHIPAGEPVVFELESPDVLHSFYVPAFRNKKDVVPGRTTKVWVEAIDPTPDHYDPHADKGASPEDRARKLLAAANSGHHLFCAEFCGTDHSRMLARVVVHPRGWRPADEPMPTDPVAKGRFLFTKTHGCLGCHGVTPGAVMAGPNFVSPAPLFGRTEKIAGGGSVAVDEAYIRESIRNPGAKLVEGYGPLMPANFGPERLPEDHMEALIAYIKSLGEGKKE